MAAVIRVKRKVDEEPLNAFVLNCKRRKIIPEKNLEIAASSSSDKKEESYTILKFAGTVETQVKIFNLCRHFFLKINIF